MIRVVLAEDSQTLQELLRSLLEADSGIEVVGMACDGQQALAMTRQKKPDVVVMDVNMPVMNGLDATRCIMSEVATPIVIVSATLDVREVEVSMAALDAGALTILPKPHGPGSDAFTEDSRRFVAAVKNLAGVKMVTRRRARVMSDRLAVEAPSLPVKVRLVAIAASTGGPMALGKILGQLPQDYPAPILIVQHISAGFVAGLADWLDSLSAVRVKVAENDERLSPATAYLAPDDHHLGVSTSGRIRLSEADAVRGFRPSASWMFASVANAFGRSAVAVVLTGMGADGLEGLHSIRGQGGQVIVQDEESSIVFGMPKAAIEAGLADSILPLTSISTSLANVAAGRECKDGSHTDC